jgi:hypothetical protein
MFRHLLSFAHWKKGSKSGKNGDICVPVLWLSPRKSQLPSLPVSGLVHAMQ